MEFADALSISSNLAVPNENTRMKAIALPIFVLLGHEELSGLNRPGTAGGRLV